MLRCREARVQLAPGTRGSFAQWRAQRNAKYYAKIKAKRAQEAGASAVAKASSQTPAAVRKREQRLKERLAQSEERVRELERLIKENSKESAAQLLRKAAAAEENLEAALAALDRAQLALAAAGKGHASVAVPMFQLRNGEYETEFQMLCAKVVNSGAAPEFAGAIIQAVTQYLTKQPSPAVPCANTIRKYVRKAGIVAEAVIAQKVAQHKHSNAVAALSIDHTTKYGIGLHGAALHLPDGTLPVGVSATPSKSAADQCAANKRMRDDVSDSGHAVFGLERADMLTSVGATLADDGKAEEKTRLLLEMQKHLAATEQSDSATMKRKRALPHRHAIQTSRWNPPTHKAMTPTAARRVRRTVMTSAAA